MPRECIEIRFETFGAIILFALALLGIWKLFDLFY